jgi:hypothetical protein
MRTIAEFAEHLVGRYADELGADNHRVLVGDVGAGEFEVAAICVMEDASVSAEEIDELERLSADFDPVDRGSPSR